MTALHIAVAGPARLEALAPLLDDPVPAGLSSPAGGTPVTQLSAAYLRAGHQVSLLTLADPVVDPIVLRGPGLTVHIGTYRPARRARDAFAAERGAIVDAARASRADVIHAHWTYEFALGALASGTPTIVTARDWAPTILRLQPHPYRVVRLGMSRAALRRASHVTATSPYLRDRVGRWARGEVTLVPNALDDAHVVNDAPRPSETDEPVIVSINNGWDRRKNVATLLEAFAEVGRRVPGASLVLIGTPYGAGEAAEAWARDRGLGARVEFAGRLPHADAMERLAAADLLVHPSREESFGMTLVEAMARGTPVVAGRDSGAVPWVCAEGRAGALTDVGDAGALATTMVRLLEDPPRRAALAEAGLANVRHRFTLSRVVDQYVTLFEHAIEEAR